MIDLTPCLHRLVPVSRLVEYARDLRSEHGENPEYDRALVELMLDAMHVPIECRKEVEVLLDIKKTVEETTNE